MKVLALQESDRPWVAGLCRRLFGSETVVVLGRARPPARLPGLVAWEGPDRAGALCFSEEPPGAEVVLLAAEQPGRGTGTALLTALAALGRARGWANLRLFTTNDNTDALAFYQRRGWDLVALHPGVVEQDRRLQPTIPVRGAGGIPIRHLLELELRLADIGEAG